ncbi:hypothetical protein TIFTF001_050818 [Ficus carica]|uniref:Uncharacterized protein n=1 Tax=Ficus carica TaxID=3494 RepID=A0AA88CJI3_FICCA|nr:hypothetical protein TIFTF001_050818 [Ficus carica]
MAAAGGKINVEALTRKIEGKLSDKKLSPQCSIFKIPAILLRHNKNAYEPNAFSFGPFHHGKENLKATETIKAKYLHDLISRLSSPNNDPNPVQTRTLWIKKFTEDISAKWEESRQYYGGPIDMKEDQFVEVLVLDGCFIIELFRKKAYEDLREKDDPVFSMSCLLQFLLHDLILLENQIPWMVLDTLFNLTRTSIDKKYLVELAIDFFGNIFSTTQPPIRPLLSHPSKHILDLLRNSLVLTSAKKNHKSNFEGNIDHMPSATNLDDFGITFKKDTDTPKSILDIDFNEKNGEMTIPPLLYQETTETVFRNLISLEQCCPNYDPIITSYAVLLDNLINTHKDMEILCKNGAITSWLNLDKATKSFDNLYIDTYVKESFYRKLTLDVDKYCRRSWNRNRRSLVRDYIKPPWVLVSVIAASIALILSFLQTLFTIMNK